jgi:hypothetical protein
MMIIAPASYQPVDSTLMALDFSCLLVAAGLACGACDRTTTATREDHGHAQLPPPSDADRRALDALLASGDDVLADRALEMVNKVQAANRTPAQRDLCDSDYTFIVVSDDGLGWFAACTDCDFPPERARDSLHAVGLDQHATIFGDLIAARARGEASDALIDALTDRWDALPSARPTVAAWIRAHVDALDLVYLVTAH